MTIPIFQTQVGQKAGLRHELKALLQSSVVLCTKFHAVWHSTQFPWNVPSRASFFSREMTSRPLSVSQPNSRLKNFFFAGAEQESACALFPIL